MGKRSEFNRKSNRELQRTADGWNWAEKEPKMVPYIGHLALSEGEKSAVRCEQQSAFDSTPFVGRKVGTMCALTPFMPRAGLLDRKP